MPTTSNATFTYTYASHDVDSDGLYVWAQVCSQPPQRFQLDTGSSGMIIGRNALKKVNLSSYPCFGPGQMHYIPSNNIRSGTWYYLPVTLVAALSGRPAGKTIGSYAMVLVVSDPPDFEVGIMGVSAKGDFPNYNVLLNAYQSSSLVQSYVLTNQAAIIGANYNAPGEGSYTFVKLQPPSTPPTPPQQTGGSPTVIFSNAALWSPPTAEVTITPASGQPANFGVAFLMDTGINQMLITAASSDIPAGVLAGAQSPSGAASKTGMGTGTGSETGTGSGTATGTATGTGSAPQPAVAPRPFIPNIGTTIQLELNNAAGSALLNYTFPIKNPPAMEPPETPADVIYRGAPGNDGGNLARINAGIHPLRNHLYMFDAANGYIGFAPLPQP